MSQKLKNQFSLSIQSIFQSHALSKLKILDASVFNLHCRCRSGKEEQRGGRLYWAYKRGKIQRCVYVQWWIKYKRDFKNMNRQFWYLLSTPLTENYLIYIFFCEICQILTSSCQLQFPKRNFYSVPSACHVDSSFLAVQPRTLSDLSP